MGLNPSRQTNLLFLLAGLLLAFPLPLLAQVWASISGVVKDESNAAIPGATVTVKSLETGFIRRVVTDEAGRYDVVALTVGSYKLRVDKQGFRPEVRSPLALSVGEQMLLDFTLRLGEFKQEVTITGNASTLTASITPTSGLVGERQVKDLPLNGRSYDELLTLNPGIVNYTAEKTGGVGISNSAVGNMFAVSGRRPQENLFLLNGIEYTGAAEINFQPGGTSGQLLGVDAVREFNVASDAYGAEYGKRPGAQVSVVTASGTNQIHGAIFDFLRNSALDARNFFDRGSIPNFQRNQFGGTLGGPVQRDKTFVFGNYEGFRQHLGLSDVTLVPDNEARQGNLPDPNGTLVPIGVGLGVVPLLDLWPEPNGPDLGGGGRCYVGTVVEGVNPAQGVSF
jgi:hypothetical protein